MIQPIVIGLLAITVGFLAVQVVNLHRHVDSGIRYIENQNKRSQSLRRMAEVEATLTELQDAYDALLSSHKKLRARIGMRATREKRANGKDRVDLTSDAEKSAYKAQLRADLKAKGML